MKKIRNKIILMLIVIMLISNTLAGLMARPLIAEFFTQERVWVVELVQNSLELALALIIFTLFIILGVREITMPLMRLSAATKRIAGGDYSAPLTKTKRKDEVGELERNFAVMVDELKSTEYIQKDFVSNVSHEYRTPLAVIVGYAKLLGDDALPAAERKLFSAFIVDEASRLSDMTSNMLLLSKLENASIQPPMEVFSLDERLRQVVLLYIPELQDKGISIELDVPELLVRGNEDLLTHVFTNLLDNAIKFTPKDGSISIYALAGQGVATISVSDNGIGMDAETLNHIYDQFYQGDPSRQGAGNGLGLTLVKRIVELHHGSLQVDSQPGIGSAFSVMLPFTDAV